MSARWMLAFGAVFLAAALFITEDPRQFAWAADSFTVTAVGDDAADVGAGWQKSFKVVKLAWKAAPSGVKANETIPAVKGRLALVVTNPGSTAPADNYDLYIKDAEGVDVLNAAGENRDTANSEQVVPKIGTDAYAPRPVYGPLTFSVSATTNADCTGEVLLYYYED